MGSVGASNDLQNFPVHDILALPAQIFTHFIPIHGKICEIHFRRRQAVCQCVSAQVVPQFAGDLAQPAVGVGVPGVPEPFRACGASRSVPWPCGDSVASPSASASQPSQRTWRHALVRQASRLAGLVVHFRTLILDVIIRLETCHAGDG